MVIKTYQTMRIMYTILALESFARASIVTPTQGRITSGYSVSINMVMLNQSVSSSSKFSCLFSCANSSNQTYTGIADAQSSSLLCFVSRWPFKTCLADISILDNSTGPINFGQNSLVFFFSAEWKSLSPVTAPTVGGANLRIMGAGFDQSKNYTCRFSLTNSLSSVLTTANFITMDELLCISPVFNFASRSRSAYFSLEEGRIPLPGPPSTVVVSFSASAWFSASPLSFSSAGGVNITVQGARFNTLNLPYRMQFRSSTFDEVLNCGCIVYHQNILFCETPKWRGESGPVTDIPMEMTLFDSIGTIGKTNDPAVFTLYGVGEWNRFETQFSTPWSQYRSACLGSKVLIYGKNFRNDTVMSCTFNSTGGRSITIPATEHSFGYVICPVPNNLNASDEAVDVSLIDGNGVTVQIPFNATDLSGDRRVNITNPCWNGDVYPSSGPALGGSTLTLTGTGFCSLGSDCANAFLCQFQAVENSSWIVYSKPSVRAFTFMINRFFSRIQGSRQKAAQLRDASRIVNNTQILCTVPNWPFVAKKIRVLLIDIRTGLDNGRPVGVMGHFFSEISQFNFMFTPYIVNISPTTIPADGLPAITVLGSGFGDLNTSCQFQFKNFEISQNATKVNMSAVICSAPPWPVMGGDTADAAATISVLQGSATSSVFRSNHRTLVYLPQFLGLAECISSPPCSNSTGYSGILFSINIHVRGFDSFHTGSYQLRFSAPTGQQLIANIYSMANDSNPKISAVDYLILQAKIPKWPFPAMMTKVSLISNLYTLIPSESGNFEFQQLALNLTDSILPVALPSCPSGICWPIIVTVIGAGFRKNPLSKTIRFGPLLVTNESYYSCDIRGLSDGTQTILFSVVTVDSSTQIRCITDLTGPIDYVAQTYSLSLRFKGIPIPSGISLRLDLSSVWTSLDCAPSSVCAGAAIGGFTLGVVGYGFGSEMNFSCSFVFWNGSVELSEYSIYSTATFVSARLLKCLVPVWPHAEGQVKVHLVTEDRSHILEALQIPALFQYEAVWWFDAISLVIAGGDSTATVIVNGRGFVSHDKYLGSYECTDFLGLTTIRNATSFVSALSSTNLTLYLPDDVGSEGNVTVTIFRCSRFDRCKAISPSLYPGSFAHFRVQSVAVSLSMRIMGNTYTTACTTEVVCWSPASGEGTLEVIASGFRYVGTEYLCNFNSGNRSISSLAHIMASGNLLCIIPFWPYEPGPVELSVWSGISGWLKIQAPYHLMLSSVVQLVSPTQGSVTGSIITISGLGFEGKSFSCRFAAIYEISPHSYTIFFIQSFVPAQVKSNSSLICNTSGAWDKYPAMETTLDIIYEDSDCFLIHDLLLNETQLLLPFTSQLSLWNSHLSIGVCFLIGNETLRVKDMECQDNQSCVLFVERGVRGSKTLFHPNASSIKPILPLKLGKDRLSFAFRPVIHSLNQSSARVDGGVILGISASGLMPSYTKIMRTAQNASCNVSHVLTPHPAITSAGPQAWGVAFDVSTKHEIQIVSLSFSPAVNGTQKLWILHRKPSSCGEGLTCSNWEHGLLLDDWEYLSSSDGLNLNVNSSNAIPVPVSLDLRPGERRGFLLIAEKGLQVGLPFVGSSRSLGTIKNHPERNCSDFAQDSNVEIHPGQLILAQSSRVSGKLFSLTEAFGDETTPYRFQGNLVYSRNEIVGAKYGCTFSATISGVYQVARSAPVPAFSKDIEPFPRHATSMVCIVPQWDYGDSKTRFSIMSPNRNVFDTDSSENPFFFKFDAALSTFVGPIQGSATGGSTFTIMGIGLRSEYFTCLFSAAYSSSAVPFNAMTYANDSSVLLCSLMNWPFTASKVFVELGKIDGNLSSFAAVPWLNASAAKLEFTIYEVWDGIYPTEGIAGGGYPIFVHGAGFDSSVLYFCVFQDRFGHSWNVSAQPFNSSSLQFNLLVPAWGNMYSSTATTVKLFRGSVNGIIAEVRGSDKIFQFRHTWGVKHIFVNQSIGSLVVIIEGFGFNTSSNYSLKFTPADKAAWLMKSTGYAETPTKIVSTVQEWRFDGPMNLSLSDWTGDDICSSGTPLCSDFQVIVSLSETYLLVQPSFASAEGGQLLTVKGAGFDQNSVNNYSCSFLSLKDSSINISSNATVHDFSHLYCRVPAVREAGDYELRILHGEQIVVFSTLFTSSENFSSSEGFPFRIVEAWTWVGNVRHGPASGNSVLSFRVFGLALNVSHFCLFISGTAELCSPARVNGTSSLTCVSEPWGDKYPASVVGLFVLDHECTISYQSGRSPKFLPDSLTVGTYNTCDYPACWSFESSWLNASGYGRANGRDNISVVGYGFKTDLYTLVFAGQIRNVSSVSFRSSVQEICFKMPQWNFAEERTSLFLQDGSGQRIQKIGEQAYFNILGCWNSKSISSSAAVPEDLTPIVIRGFGFDRTADGYQCRFFRDNYSTTTEAAPLDVHVMACDLPTLWAYKSGFATIQLLKNGVNGVPTCSDNNSTDVSFLFLDGWVDVSVSEAPASEGFEFVMSGYGFDKDSKKCICQFVNDKTVMNHTAKILNDSYILCRTPSWGSDFPSAVVTLSLEIDGRLVPFRNLSSSRSKTPPRLNLYTVWITAYVEGEISGPSDSVLGGGTLVIIGSGFDTNSRYTCLFGTDEVYAEPKFPQNTTYIRFHVPPWAKMAESVRLTVANNFSRTKVPLVVSYYSSQRRDSEIRFTFIPVWSDIRSGTLYDGTSKVVLSSTWIWILGYGFNSGKNYTCKFSVTNQTRADSYLSNIFLQITTVYESAALFHSNDSLKCISPNSTKTMGYMKISIFDSDGNRLRGPGNGTTTFEVTCSWYGKSLSQGSSLGGSNMTIWGDGFDENRTYHCEFRSDNVSNRTSADVRAHNEVTCTVPEWHYPPNAVVSLYHDDRKCWFVDAQHNAFDDCTRDSCPQSAFDFLPIVRAISPTTGSAGGGIRILVIGSGFWPSLNETCVFSAVGCTNTTISTAEYINNSAIHCVVPLWTCSASKANISFGSFESVFEYTPIVFSTVETKSYAKAEIKMKVSGAGFSLTEEYVVLFFGKTSYSNYQCNALSSNAMECHISGWGGEAENVSLTFQYKNGTNVSTNKEISFEFQAGWDYIDPSTANGSSSGGSSVAIIAYGLDCATRYVCVFSHSGKSLTTNASCSGSSLLKCLTPGWGLQYEASSVQLSIRTDDFRMLPFTNNSSYEIDPTLCEEQCKNARFTFMSEWNASAVVPTAIAAAGNQPIYIHGSGFSTPGNYSLVIHNNRTSFELFTAQLRTISTTLLMFISPKWEYPVSNINLELWEVGGHPPLIQNGHCRIAIYSGLLAIVPSTGPAGGNVTITILGFGLQGQDIWCKFNGTLNSSAQILSSEQAVCLLPSFSGPARTITFGLFSVSLGYQIPAYSRSQEYLSEFRFEGNTTDFQLFAEYYSISPIFADRLGKHKNFTKIMVLGYGFDLSVSYLCRFSSKRKPTLVFQNLSLISGPGMLVCSPPVWDVVTVWQEYDKSLNIATFELFVDVRPNPIIGWLDSELVSVLRNDMIPISPNLKPAFVFEQINTVPFFEVRSNISLCVTYLTTKQAVIPRLIYGIMPGDHAVERFQKITFRIIAPQVFQEYPWISDNGDLIFALSTGAMLANTLVGTSFHLELQILLQDDGGRENGGADLFERRITLAVSNPPLQAFLKNSNVVLLECKTCDVVMVPRFLCGPLAGNVCLSMNSDYLAHNGIVVELLFNNIYFSVYPVFNASLDELTFTLAPFVFGRVNISVVMMHDHKQTLNLSLDIRNVNHRPSFKLNTPVVSIFEFQPGYFRLQSTSPQSEVNANQTLNISCIDRFCEFKKFASSILPGPDTSRLGSTGPGGENWAETDQHLTFLIFGGSLSFSQQLSLSPAGDLTFAVSDIYNDKNTFSVRLYDDGGTEDDGNDESLEQQFIVHVELLHRAPRFEFSCNPDDERVRCSCESHSKNCTMFVTVGRYCGDCLLDQSCNDGINCENRCFSVDSIVQNVFPAQRGIFSYSRSNQNLSFVIQPKDNIQGMFYVDRDPTINALNGSLQFCLSNELCVVQDVSVSFNVVLVDDIGDSLGQNTSQAQELSVILKRVNQRPSFKLRGSSVSVWGNSGITVLPWFAFNITRGNVNSSMYDCEIDQQITFIIEYDRSSLGPVSIETNSGNLSFEVKPNVYGKLKLEIILQDDGRTERNGKAVSEKHILNLFVIESYTKVEIPSNYRSLQILSLYANITNLLTLSPSQIYVSLGSSEKELSCDSYAIKQMWTNNSGSICFCLPTCVCVASNSNLHTDRMNSAFICILASSRDAAVLGADIISRSFNNETKNVSVMAMVRNFQANSFFNLRNSSLIYVGSHVDPERVIYEPNFVVNVVGPENMRLNRRGTAEMDFDIVPIGRRAYPGLFSWIFDGDDGGLLALKPSVQAECGRQSCGGCAASCTGVLSLRLNPSYNGEVIYAVRLAGTKIVRNLTIGVRLAFSYLKEISLTSPDAVNAIIPNFITAKFACGLFSSLPFDFAIEIRHEFAVKSARVDVVNKSLNLWLELTLGKLGNQTFWLYAGDSESVADATPCHIMILFRNYPPFFAFNCGGINSLACSGGCALTHPDKNCTVTVKTNQNCGQCKTSGGCCLEHPAIVSWNQSVGPLFWNETDQNVTFIIIAELGSGHFDRLNIDPLTGNFTICSSFESAGQYVFRVDLFDDGGTLNGGSNMSRPGVLMIEVTPVNQAPSFQLNPKFDVISVWASQQRTWVFHQFATNISKGRKNREGFDLEWNQQATFIVLDISRADPACYGLSLCSGFQAVNIDLNGTLSFKLSPSWSGIMHLSVYLEDDGGIHDCGQNSSVRQNFTILVPNSYVQFSLLIYPDLIFNSTLVSTIILQVSWILVMQKDLILFVPPNATLATKHNTRRLLVSSDISSPLSFLYIFSPSKLETIRKSLLEINVKTVIIEVLKSNNLNRNVSIVSTKLYVRNLDPYFDILLGTIEAGCRDVFHLPKFFQNITGPSDNALFANGSETIQFVVYAIRFRPNNFSNWSMQTNGDMFDQEPFARLICDPECKNADLIFQSKKAYNGEVEYSASIIGDNPNILAFSRNFTIVLGPCFAYVHHVIYNESQPYTTIPCFAEYFFGVGISYPMMTPSFSLKLSNETSALFHVPPVLLSNGSCVNLTFQIRPYWNGNVSLYISALNIQKSFMMTFLPVNYAPSFLMNSSELRFSEYECSAVPCTRHDFVTFIHAGPEEAATEKFQGLRFEVYPLHVDEGLFAVIPNITLIQDNITGKWTAFLAVRTEKDRYSLNTSYFKITLLDNGSPSISETKQFGIWIQKVNRPPTFDLIFSAIDVWENSRRHIKPFFAQNISAGNADEDESQMLSFRIELNSFVPGLQPVLYRNGTLEFEIYPGLYGTVVLTIVLFDDGGTMWNGSNKSLSKQLNITAHHVNYAPTFCLTPASGAIFLYEVDASKTETVLFAMNIISGPEIESNQSMSFIVIDVDANILVTAGWTSLSGDLFKDVNIFIEKEWLSYASSSEDHKSTCNSSKLPRWKYGYMNLTLQPFQYGNLTIRTALKDDGGTLHSGRNSSDVVDLTISVLPVHHQPLFYTVLNNIIAMEGKPEQIYHNLFVINITGQKDKTVFFIFNASDVFDEIYGSCYVESGQCSNSSAYLRFTPKPFIFGNFTIQLALKNSHCCGGRGVDTSSWATLNISILPFNDPPSFKLSTGDFKVTEGSEFEVACITHPVPNLIWTEYRIRPVSGTECGTEIESGFLNYSLGAFAFDISLGKYEWSSEGCHSPYGGSCESQNGWFRIEELDTNISSRLFQTQPKLDLITGRLNFTLNPLSCGTANFRVSLVDYGALDGTSKTSTAHTVSIRVLPVDHAPDFEVRSASIFEDEGTVETVLVQNIAPFGFQALSGYCSDRSEQSLTFSLELEPSDLVLFSSDPTFSVNGSNGLLTFKLLNDSYGNIRGIISAQVRGGMTISKNFSIEIAPTNDRPSFLLNPSLATVQVSQAPLCHEFPHLVYEIAAGPKNEDHQNLTFVISQQSNPTLLFSGPHISLDGILTFCCRSDISGTTEVVFFLQDDGIGPGDSNSRNAILIVVVTPIKSAPSFSFITERLQFKESSGTQLIESFITDLNTQQGYLPTSEAVFVPNNEGLEFKEVRINNLSKALTLAVDYVRSPDGDHVYVAEYTTNTISVWAVKSDASIFFLDRLAEPASALMGPISIDISNDGKFVYVSCSSSPSILTFLRDNWRNSCKYGTLSFTAEASYYGLSETWYTWHCIQKYNANLNATISLPLAELGALKVSKDLLNLYTVTFSGSLITFIRNRTTGALSPLDHFLNNNTQLSGARGLSISGDGSSLFVASWVDQSVLAYRRDHISGRLQFSDSIRNGERLLWKYRDSVDEESIIQSDLQSQQEKCSRKQYPLRLGDGFEWASSARGSKSFQIDNRTFLAIAASDPDPSMEIGTAVLYVWNSSEQVFCLHQIFRDNKQANGIEFFSLHDNGLLQNYLVICNSFSLNAQTITVLLWNSLTQVFMHHHTPDLGADWTYTNGIRYFFAEGKHHLAVARHRGSGVVRKGHPCILVWKLDMIRSTDGTNVSRSAGFQHFQQIAQPAVSVDFAFFGETPLLFFATSSAEVSQIDWIGSSLDVHMMDHGQFHLVQSIPADGAYGIEPFSFSEGHFVALARRQSRKQEQRNDYLAFDTDSLLYKWNFTAKSLFLFQILGGPPFLTVAEDGTSPEHLYEFCYPSNISSADGTSQPILSLRGVTAFKSFTLDGEQYLSVAQSVCDAFVGRNECDMVQPKSAIFQFNKFTQKFGEMLTMTEELWHTFYDMPFDEKALSAHVFPLRMNVGRAVGWDMFSVGERRFLLALSLTKGALLFDWSFDHVSGLKGAFDIASDAAGSNVFVLSALDSALVHISQVKEKNMLRTFYQKCNPCLRFDALISKVHESSTIHSKTFSSHAGFLGAQKIEMLGLDSSTLYGFRELVVSFDVPVEKRLCPDFIIPEFSTDQSGTCDHNRLPTNKVFQCQNLSFLIDITDPHSVISSGGVAMNRNGSLVLGIEPFQHGEAVIKARLQSSTIYFFLDNYSSFISSAVPLIVNVSNVESFSLGVLSLNDRPTFVVFDIFTSLDPIRCAQSHRGDSVCIFSDGIVSDGTVETSAVFAQNVSAGVGEARQNMSWKFEYSNKNMFSGTPDLQVTKRDSMILGTIIFNVPSSVAQGISCFNISLMDDGPSNSTYGDNNESFPGFFCLNLRFTSRLLRISNNSLAIQASTLVEMKGFLPEIQQQSRACTLQGIVMDRPFTVFVESTDQFQKRIQIFSFFDIDSCGNLKFETLSRVSGTFSVEITLNQFHDPPDKAHFSLNILPFVPVKNCLFEYISALRVLQSTEGTLINVPNAFNISSIFYTRKEGSIISIVNSTNLDLFKRLPILESNASLSLQLNPLVTGTSLFTFKLTNSHCGAEEYFYSTLTVVDAPSFSVINTIQATQGMEAQTFAGVVYRISTQGRCEPIQCMNFMVSWVSHDVSFDEPPGIDYLGTLRFKSMPNSYGAVTLTIQIKETDIFNTYDFVLESVVKNCTLIIQPKLQIYKVLPSFGPIQGGTRVTLQGLFWVPNVWHPRLEIFFGWNSCQNVTSVVSVFLDPAREMKWYQEIVCTTGPGMGLTHVSLVVWDGILKRGIQLPNMFVHALALYGGTLLSKGGFVGIGPQSSDPRVPSEPGPSLQNGNLSVSGSVLDIRSFNGSLILAGSFQYADDMKVDHIFLWNSMKSKSLGRGLDGAVKSLTVYKDMVICGGLFTRAFSNSGKFIKCGGLVAWTGFDWMLVNRPLIGSIINVLSSNRTHLVIAGRHTKQESAHLGALASFDGTSWTSVGGGVYGGDIHALVLREGSVYIGGSFSRVGELSVSKLARWDGQKWHSLGSYDGPVRSILLVGQRIFVGGDFSDACGRGLAYLVKFESGECSPVSDVSLNSAVLSMKWMSSCLYFGGSFTSSGDPCRPQYLGRWCQAEVSSQYTGSGCGLQQIQEAQGLGPVRVIWDL